MRAIPWIALCLVGSWIGAAALRLEAGPGAVEETKAAAKEAAKDTGKEEGKKETEAKDAGKAEGRAEEAKPEKKAEKAEKKAEKAAGILEILKLKEKPKGKEAEAKKEPGERAAEAKEEAKPADVPGEKAAEAAEKTAKSEKAEKKAGEGDVPVEVKLDEPPATKPKKKKKDGEKKDAAKPAKKKEPEQPMFRLRDGTRLAGTPDLKVLSVATPYGKLTVPVPEVVRVRLAAAEDPQLAGRIAESVKGLSSEEFDKREEAMAALREIGLPALEALKKALVSEDEEVKTRAEKLVSEIEEQVEDEDETASLVGPIAGEEDEVVTLKFTVKGRVEEESFQLATRYGSLNLSRKDIVSIVFRDSPHATVTFQVPAGTFAGANKWFDTKLAFAQGERLHISASGQINLEQYGQTTGPEGTSNISGNQLGSFATGALVGKIGEKGQPFLIGTEHDASSNAAGNLFLGISLQNGQVSGQFEVDVEKEGEAG
ncbi:MAG: hypothetical protein HY721_33070 [Planctomycetes bacterium]|nr:hypothetical protein [Planctomycetota bacterium]